MNIIHITDTTLFIQDFDDDGEDDHEKLKKKKKGLIIWVPWLQTVLSLKI